jgi:hypothetical protein
MEARNNRIIITLVISGQLLTVLRNAYLPDRVPGKHAQLMHWTIACDCISETWSLFLSLSLSFSIRIRSSA